MAKTETDAKKAVKALGKKGAGKKHLVILMDESGSMLPNQEAVVTGCNEFLASFKKDKDTYVTLAWFDEYPGEPRTRFKVKAQKIKDVDPLKITDYNPRGMTPLNDAIVDTVAAIDKKAGKEETVFVAIITDGLENASETDVDTVRQLIGKREAAGWGFVYLGAHAQVTQTAAALGLGKKGQSFAFSGTPVSTSNAMKTAASLGGTRMAAGAGAAGNAVYASAAAGTYDKLAGQVPDDEDYEPPEDD